MWKQRGPNRSRAGLSLLELMAAVTMASTLVVSTAVLLLLAHRIGPMPAKGVAILLGFVCNYAASAFFVFGASHGERRGA